MVASMHVCGRASVCIGGERGWWWWWLHAGGVDMAEVWG